MAGGQGVDGMTAPCVRITKTFAFSAAHHLPNVPEDHQCRRPHGHNYTVTLECEGTPDPGHGMLVDYGLISDTFGRWLDEQIDHRDLNELAVLDLDNTTAEMLAVRFYEIIKQAGWYWAHTLRTVTVSEMPTTSATYPATT